MYNHCFSEEMRKDVAERLDRIIKDKKYKDDAGFLSWVRDFVIGIWEIEEDKFKFNQFMEEMIAKREG